MGISKCSQPCKADAVQLMRQSNRSLKDIAKTVGVCPKTLRTWETPLQTDQGNGPIGALSTQEKLELQRLRKECRELRKERDFLKQAATYFAKEKP